VGERTSWTSYVAVESADASAERCVALGGTLMAGPFDVVDAGRTAVVADPQGAALALWEPRAHAGAGLVNEPGALCLNQLNTSDPAAAGRFYADLFGWEARQVASGPDYWGITNRGRLNAGMMALPPGAPAPPHWLVYFTSADIDGSVAGIERLGGQVVLPPMEVPGGRVAVAADPQGAPFALVEGRMDP
jgi:hypothetical protein